MVELPAGVQVFERGWLSSNNVLLGGDPRGAVLVDTGYCSHVAQTAALLAEGLRDEPGGLRLIVNTHLHSDHCGGNAHLQQLHCCPVWIPPGDFEAAKRWDEAALSYRATGQQCPRFTPTATLMPGSTLVQAGRQWQVHAAPGHDPHSVLLFEPASRLLISADALWERGFGIVFPEIDGIAAFDEVEASLDLIESLQPVRVIPGHGRIFDDVQNALREARSRLSFFRTYPERHARHAAKALIMFHLLEVQQVAVDTLQDGLDQTPIHTQIWRRYFGAQSPREWNDALLKELQHAGAVAIGDGIIQAK